jgi:anti-sigma regulatory factor (Ser/Thr protein kinase)
MSRLHCDLDGDGPVTIARLDGPLTLADTPLAWNTLVKLLGDQPDALLVDLGGLDCDDPSALLVFGALARRASLWPGVPVILSVPGADLRSILARHGVDRVVAVCPDLNEARVLAHSAPTPPRLRRSMLPVPGAARAGRDLATEACLRWACSELIASASIVASELVTNAVRHAGTPFELTLAHTPRYLHIAVRDDDPRPAVRQEHDVLASGGRGLRIVERTALSWGSSPAQSGKVVWATLSATTR